MSQGLRFEDKTVLVTGGSSGIGRETSMKFGEEGANVVIGDIDRTTGEEVATAINDETNGTASFIHTDVTDSESVSELMETVTSKHGRLDIAFNNAGIGSVVESTDEITEASWNHTIEVNLTGIWRCLRHEIPVLRTNNGGSVVNTASILGKVGTRKAPAYTASKHGVVGLTKTAALECATDDIRINAVCPGYTDTQMLDDIGVTEDKDTEAKVASLHPMQRLGEPKEIANAVVWLASDEASFTTGETMLIDGGYASR